MKIISYDTIKTELPINQCISIIERGFVAYSKGEVIVPPVGYLPFQNGGGTHIKYGYIKGDAYFVIKVASGFPGNFEMGLPVTSGLMLVMDADTGCPLAILEDRGYLTEVRTAIAGLICARYLAPKEISCVGIVGCGGQARYQLEYLKQQINCRQCIVWGRNNGKVNDYCKAAAEMGFEITIADNLEHLAKASNLIVTTTASNEALLLADWIKPGTHITAMGADAPGKQELDEAILSLADIVVVDSISQCVDHGEIHKAIKSNKLQRDKLVELGNVIENPNLGRDNEKQITVADLTGVAVQDIQIAKLVYQTCS